ncbi:opsin-3 [Rhinophrynus dorsalis]
MSQTNNSNNSVPPAANSHNAFTEDTHESLVLIASVIGFLGLLNNMLVLILYYKFKRLRTPRNLLLVNISLSDFLLSLFGVHFTLMSSLDSQWVFDAAYCVIDGFSKTLFGIVSITTLTVLAYERYNQVLYGKVIDLSWSKRTITYIWIYSLAWTGAPLIGWNRYTFEIHGLGCSLYWLSSEFNDATYVFFFFFACFIVPVGIMCYCYGHILYVIRMLRQVPHIQTIQAVKLLDYEIKAAKMCFLMILSFLLCWMPYAVVSLLVACGMQNVITPTTAIIQSFFAKSSAAFNPVLYVFTIKKFRQCLVQLLCYHFWRILMTLNCRVPVWNEKAFRPNMMNCKVGNRPNNVRCVNYDH